MKQQFLRLRAAVVVAAMLFSASAALAQSILPLIDYKGNRLYRAKNYMSGNLVRTVYYNYGLAGNIGEISGEWPIGTGDEYVGDVSPLVGVEFIHPSGDTLHSVCTSDGPRGNSDGPPGGGRFWGFEPLPGFNAPPLPGKDPLVALSNQSSTWPRQWPDKYYTDVRDSLWEQQTDRGWPGTWNGYFGKSVFSADQETYYQMDDNADEEWFSRQDTTGHTYYFYPDPHDSTRRGLGLRVAVRGLQWAHFLAQDCIFWLYDITNLSQFTYDKVCFGMMVGTLSGGRQDSQDDLAYFDLANDITYSWDCDDRGSPGWVPVRPGEINVGYVGYAFLESPGNPYDGIDNDGDSQDASSPVLTSTLLYQMTQPRTFHSGDQIVMINYDNYQRTDTTFPADSLIWYIHGRRHVTHALIDTVVENGHNGIDDNFNGLIDERWDSTMINHKYKDYLTGAGVHDLMIDEARDDGIDNNGNWNSLTDDIGADGVAGTGDAGEGDGRPTNGEPNFDRTDVNESDQIGLTAFDYFSPPGSVRMNDDPALWAHMAPGHFDVVPGRCEDGDFIYGSGYFPLRPGQTERFSMALLYGEDLNDIRDNKRTVQQIYDENYNFARPPDKPTAWAVPGDGRVTLYWDDKAESSFERTCSCYDFEGYKIYRSTDPSFNEVFTITDGLGRRTFYRPIAQFDKADSLRGFFPVIRNSVIFYLGDDTGLQHSWTDTTVENGQVYYYAVVAYDHGDVAKEILPSENTKTIVVNAAGDVTLDINTVRVTPRAPAAGYEGPEMTALTHSSGFATGSVAFEIVDPRLVKDNYSYALSFAIDSLGLNFSVLRSVPGLPDSLALNHVRFLPQDNLLSQARRFSSYFDSLFNLVPGLYDPAQHFVVANTPMFDGQLAYMLQPRDTSLITEISGWADTAKGLYQFTFSLVNLGIVPDPARRVPGDWEIEWFDHVVDTSRYFADPGNFEIPAVPVNYIVKNTDRNQRIGFAFLERSGTINGRVDNNEVVIFFDSLSGQEMPTWAVRFTARAADGDTVQPANGDRLILKTYQPLSPQDRYVYSTRAARVNRNAVSLDRIKVYPNPYVSVSAQEPSNPYNEGRGERRITFIHLPDQCTIRVYTVRGELVQKITHTTTIDDGMENWDLRSLDGLNVAYGVYLYHIDSPYGEKIGRFAVIK
jgi:hypothetical protein